MAVDVRPVLLVTGDLVRTGGMDMANLALANHLAERGREVHIVAHRVAPELVGKPNVMVHRVRRPSGSHLAGAPLLDHAGRYWAARVARRGGRVIVNGGNCRWPDVNWVHYVHAAAPSRAGGMMTALKSAVTGRLFRWQERRALDDANLVIANSERTRRDLVERLGIAPGRIQVVYLGVDRDRFRPPSAPEREDARTRLGVREGLPCAVFVGALGDRRKGFDTLFEAWRQVSQLGSWDVDLLVVGTGAELPYWRARSEAAGLGARIRFLGFQPTVESVLWGCDLLVAPSRYEPYGLAIQEALCCGVPAITSGSAGIAERFPPELSALLLEDTDDAGQLVQLLQLWRSDVDLLRAEAARFADVLRRRTWNDTAAEVERLLCPP